MNAPPRSARVEERQPCRLTVVLSREGQDDCTGDDMQFVYSGAGHSQNLSRGGVCCVVDRLFQPNQKVRIRIHASDRPLDLAGAVVWCEAVNDREFEVGCEFLDASDGFAARMLDQICQIEAYREMQRQEGRELSVEAAAEEWISRYAEHHPRS